MYQYRFIKEEQYNQEHGVYTAYGICGYELAQNVMRETIYLPDVFLSKTVAERFAMSWNSAWSTCTMLYRTRSAGKQNRPDHDPNDAQKGEKSRKAQAKRKP